MYIHLQAPYCTTHTYTLAHTHTQCRAQCLALSNRNLQTRREKGWVVSQSVFIPQGKGWSML